MCERSVLNFHTRHLQNLLDSPCPGAFQCSFLSSFLSLSLFLWLLLDQVFKIPNNKLCTFLLLPLLLTVCLPSEACVIQCKLPNIIHPFKELSIHCVNLPLGCS